MITINLSDEQGRKLLNAFGWRISGGEIDIDIVHVCANVAKEVFVQVENQIEAKNQEQAK